MELQQSYETDCIYCTSDSLNMSRTNYSSCLSLAWNAGVQGWYRQLLAGSRKLSCILLEFLSFLCRSLSCFSGTRRCSHQLHEIVIVKLSMFALLLLLAFDIWTADCMVPFMCPKHQVNQNGRTSDLFRLSRSMVRADPQSLRGALSGERSLHRTGLDTRPLPRRRVPQLKQVELMNWYELQGFHFSFFFSCLLLLGLLMEQTSRMILGVSPLFDVFVSCRFRVHGSFADISYDVVIGGAQPNTTVAFKSCLESWSIAFIPL